MHTYMHTYIHMNQQPIKAYVISVDAPIYDTRWTAARDHLMRAPFLRPIRWFAPELSDPRCVCMYVCMDVWMYVCMWVCWNQPTTCFESQDTITKMFSNAYIHLSHTHYTNTHAGSRNGTSLPHAPNRKKP